MFGTVCKETGCVRLWVAAVVSFGLMAHDAVFAQTDAPPMDVGTVTLTKQEVPRILSLPGRAIAYRQVSIRPRVSGVVEKILYDPTKEIAVGDPLFKLDDDSYAASVAEAEAQVATAQANATASKASYERSKSLEGTATSKAQVEKAQATMATDAATLKSAKASLDFARTQLSWTTVKSPIKGRADVASVSVGDLVVGSQSDAMTIVTTLDPIEVVMQESSTVMLKLRAEVEAGTLKITERLKAKLTLENGEAFASEGSFVAAGTTVTTTTGTSSLRFRFENPGNKILPGMFLRGDIQIGTVDAFLVPQRAAKRSNTGLLTAFIVDKDGTSKQVQFTEKGVYENNWVVETEFEPGDKVIVDGLVTMRPGVKVNPVPVTINADGLVQDDASKTKTEK
ncbi:efflux RND transporter periplasmic adaptor subunit [uncultured Roseibium sp.]|uniref:efflux RND transporter periplasmic adaptor subunit n=1 Tax=uncultured Roseibium sp. TaxID=1936171 RepID=UPI002625A28E|nr:efflux RND transporter periplasmic adaptor subunit [uncultured Roseibium sp.]